MNIQQAEAKTKETFFMTAVDSLRESILRKLISKIINGTEAAEALKLTVRQVKRLKKRFVKNGVKGILHKNRGKVSNHAVSNSVRTEIVKIIKNKYLDFGPTLASEKLTEDHKITLSSETIRQIMITGDLWKVKPKTMEKSPHVWRARKDSYGQMQQYDGSYHNWFEDRLKNILGEKVTMNCLLASIDDATGQITHAKFDDSEGVVPTLTFWQEYLKTHGKPNTIYLDRFSTYKNNLKKNTVNDLELTQFQRACRQLGIEVINAHSPQAKGRVERLFQTLQDRLIKELRLKNICTIAEANTFLTKTFIPLFNKKFAVIPKKETNLHTMLHDKELLQLPAIMSIQDNRIIMNDYTVMHNSNLYQIDPKQPTLVRAGDKVTVQTRLNRQTFIVKESIELLFTKITERPKRITEFKTEDKRLFGHKPSPSHPWKTYEQKTLLLNPVLAQV